jgi:hypothetical protein
MHVTRNLGRILMLSACLSVCGIAEAENVFQEPDSFLRDAFGGQVPKPKVLWLTDQHRAAAAKILQHSPHMLRVRYWRAGGRTAWILEEVGKERPITVGVVVDGGAIDQVAVLVYRESIGWEVRHRFFTQQFEQAELNERLMLTKPIDGIIGATLSVRAVTGVARLAVYLHGEVANGL